jgi:hypothetical protein
MINVTSAANETPDRRTAKEVELLNMILLCFLVAHKICETVLIYEHAYPVICVDINLNYGIFMIVVIQAHKKEDKIF